MHYTVPLPAFIFRLVKHSMGPFVTLNGSFVDIIVGSSQHVRVLFCPNSGRPYGAIFVLKLEIIFRKQQWSVIGPFSGSVI